MAKIVITRDNKSILIEYNTLSAQFKTDQRRVSLSSLSSQDGFDSNDLIEIFLDNGGLISLKPVDVDSINGVTIANIADLKTEFGKLISQEIDSVNTGDITVNSATAATLVAANTNRVSLTISNPHNQGLWIRPYPASDDNDKTGYYLSPDQPPYVIPEGDALKVEYSIIMNQGGSKDIPFVEVEF